MTDIASTTQLICMPQMCCHTRTDRPNDAPSESATVPTMTKAATRLRVINNMMMKMRHSAATPAIRRSYFDPSTSSLTPAAVPANESLACSRGVPLRASSAAVLIGSTREMPSGVAGSPR
ncbi:Uncharacterised protein [Mycobacteroides abscessus subsp. abscessus]|nr:Uncharacterised protein [Mycobacteroides abscessus subsp. abscessus]